MTTDDKAHNNNTNVPRYLGNLFLAQGGRGWVGNQVSRTASHPAIQTPQDPGKGPSAHVASDVFWFRMHVRLLARRATLAVYVGHLGTPTPPGAPVSCSDVTSPSFNVPPAFFLGAKNRFKISKCNG